MPYVAMISPIAPNHCRHCSPTETGFGVEVSEMVQPALERTQTASAIMTSQMAGPQKSWNFRTDSMPWLMISAWISHSETKESQPSASRPRNELCVQDSSPGQAARSMTLTATEAR